MEIEPTREELRNQVGDAQHVLHLWRPVAQEIPQPPTRRVVMPRENKQEQAVLRWLLDGRQAGGDA